MTVKVRNTDMNSERQKALENAMHQITREFGAGAIMRLGDMKGKLDTEVIPTGSLALDIAVGVGGYPRGRVIEIYGPESSGKTTLALHAIAEAQKNNGVAAFIDAEHALDPVYAHHLGVDTERLLISQPDSGEQALSICEQLVRSGAVDMIVIDSVAALVPKQEIEGDIGDQSVGLQARLMSKALRKLTGIISKSRTIVIFINQIREKVGIMFGNPETTTGGRALKFYSSIRVEIRRGEAIKNGTDVVGNRTRAKVVKNKVAPPFKTAEFDVMYGEGISKEGTLLDLATNMDIIQKSGAWYSYKGNRISQGREAAKAFLRENQEIAAEIDKIIRDTLVVEPEKFNVDVIAKNKMQKSKTAYEAALHLLKYRGQSTYELRKKLKDREYPLREIEEALSKLLHYGYVNDLDLAEDLFNLYKSKNAYGDVYIHKKMKLRGLSIDRHLTFDEEYAAALIVMKNKVKVLPALKHNYRRAAGILYRRGFPGSVITSVLQNLRISDF